MERKIRFNWGAKLFTLLFTFSVLPVLFLSYETVKDMEKKFSDMTLTNLGGLAQTKAQAVEQFMTDRVRHVERISTLVAADLDLVTKEMEKAYPQTGKKITVPEKSPETVVAKAVAGSPERSAEDSNKKEMPQPAKAIVEKDEGGLNIRDTLPSPISKGEELPEPSEIKVKPSTEPNAAVSTETAKENLLPAVAPGVGFPQPGINRGDDGKETEKPPVPAPLREAKKPQPQPKQIVEKPLQPQVRTSSNTGDEENNQLSQAPKPKKSSKDIAGPVPSKEALDANKMLRKSLGLILWDQKDYEELLIISTEGTVLLSTFDAHEGKSAVNIDYFQKGKGSTYIQHVFISPITERLTMVVATPIKDANQRIIGVLAARLNLKTFFRLIGDQMGLGETGETIVARKVESEFVFMAPTRHDAEAALNRKIEAGSGLSRPLQEAARGQAGAGAYVDYRHEAVLAAWQHIPSLDWGLVVKIDKAETNRIVKEVRQKTISLMMGILLLVLLFSALVSKALVAPLKELKDTADRVSKGELDVKININSSDEVGDLADSFERMIAAIKFFREEKDAD